MEKKFHVESGLRTIKVPINQPSSKIMEPRHLDPNSFGVFYPVETPEH